MLVITNTCDEVSVNSQQIRAIPDSSFGCSSPSFQISQKVLPNYVLNLSWGCLFYLISTGIGLIWVLIISSFRCSSGLFHNHPPHCCQCDCSEIEIWPGLYNLHMSLTSHHLLWFLVIYLRPFVILLRLASLTHPLSLLSTKTLLIQLLVIIQKFHGFS